MFTRDDLPRLKADISLDAELLGHPMKLSTKWGLFSPRAIDEGTLLLLKHLEISKTDKCLDLGCGYGPIGLSVAKSCSQGEVHLIDKDFVAIEMAAKNAEKNNIKNTDIYLSDAFSEVDKLDYFDQVISNIPAKVGREQLSIILYDAYDSLKVGGKLTFVTINGLRSFMKTNFQEVFGNYKKLKQGKNYTVSQAIKIK